MKTLGLSAEQLIERRLHLHAGDASDIMAGDYRKVCRRLSGADEGEDLSNEFRVQLGSYTEPFGLYWTQRMTGRPIEYFSANPLMRHIWKELTGQNANPVELRVSRDYPFMAYNADALSTTPQGYHAVLDAKHVGRMGEQELLRYTPAGVFQATVEGLDWWGLAPIVGNKWEEPYFQAVDPFYQATLIERCRECWGYHERGEEPPEAEAPKVLAPKPAPKLRSIIVPVDTLPGSSDDLVLDALVRGNNWLLEFLKHARAVIRTHGPATVNAIEKDEAKKIVPEDVGEIVYGRYRFSRAKNGAVTQNVKPMEGIWGKEKE